MGRGARLGNAKVDQLHDAVVVEDQVAGLDVPVDDSVAVRVLEPGAGLAHDVDRLVHLHPAAVAQDPAECRLGRLFGAIGNRNGIRHGDHRRQRRAARKHGAGRFDEGLEILGAVVAKPGERLPFLPFGDAQTCPERLHLGGVHQPGVVVLVPLERQAVAFDRVGDEHGGALIVGFCKGFDQGLDTVAAKVEHQRRKRGIVHAGNQVQRQPVSSQIGLEPRAPGSAALISQCRILGIGAVIDPPLDRRATGAPGKNWLFFGHQRSDCDFFYADELNAMKTAGLLTRLSLAWSRDGDKKFYVQDRMREVGREVWTWLAEGANIYICGDAKRMAKDVERALVDIVAQFGARSTDEAVSFVAELKKKGRFQQDVY